MSSAVSVTSSASPISSPSNGTVGDIGVSSSITPSVSRTGTGGVSSFDVSTIGVPTVASSVSVIGTGSNGGNTRPVSASFTPAPIAVPGVSTVGLASASPSPQAPAPTQSPGGGLGNPASAAVGAATAAPSAVTISGSVSRPNTVAALTSTRSAASPRQRPAVKGTMLLGLAMTALIAQMIAV